MIDPTDAENQRDIEDKLDIIGAGVELSVLLVIVERLANLEGKTVAEAFADIPKDMRKIKGILEAGQKAYTSEAVSNLTQMADANDEWAKPFYDARKVEQVKHTSNKATGAVINSAKQYVAQTVENTLNTSVLGFAVPDGKGWKCIGLQDAYKDTVSRAITAMRSGEATYQTAVREAVTALSNNGLRVMYPSGRTMELYAAVRMNVMDNYSQTMMEMRRIQGEEFGADGYEVSAHENCAPDHQPYQGQQYSMKEWRNIQPDRPIETGPNCHHKAYPIILGVSSPAYSQQQIDRMNAESNRQITYTELNGEKRTSTKYEATQYQRTIERRCRSLDSRVKMDTAAGDNDAAKKTRAEYKATKQLYKSTSEEMGLTTRDERTRAYVVV